MGRHIHSEPFRRGAHPRRGSAHRRQHRHHQARRTRSPALTGLFSLPCFPGNAPGKRWGSTLGSPWMRLCRRGTRTRLTKNAPRASPGAVFQGAASVRQSSAVQPGDVGHGGVPTAPEIAPCCGNGSDVEASSTRRWHAGGLIARASSHSATGRQALSCRLLKQPLGLLQIARVEAFREPAVHRSEKFARLLPLTQVTPDTGKASGGAQFEGSCLLLLRDT
jgi:hypothetical protein